MAKKLIALCTIVTGAPAQFDKEGKQTSDDTRANVAPGEEFEADDKEAARLVAGGHAKPAETKAKAEKEPTK